MINYKEAIDKLLMETFDKKGSDLHLVAGALPNIRINGFLVPQEEGSWSEVYGALTNEDIKGMMYAIISPDEIKHFEENLELDFGYSIEGKSRFRGNVMVQRGTTAAVIRVIPFSVPDFDTLMLPPQVKELSKLKRGLVLVTGTTGSGKSTTLAAMIDLINKTRHLNIVTIEDPIEYSHNHIKSSIRQREVGVDTKTFGSALRHILRHDPDVILIGEMRDLESISNALTAAETGCLVMSSLHTQTAPLTVSRVIDFFDSSSREQVRQQLANSLRAVVSQQLVPTADNKRRRVAVEFMIDTPSVKSQIREGKEFQLYNTIQTGQSFGMQTMDASLHKLYTEGEITKQTALEYAIERKEMLRMIEKGSYHG